MLFYLKYKTTFSHNHNLDNCLDCIKKNTSIITNTRNSVLKMVWAHFPSSCCSSSIMPLTSVDHNQNLSHVMTSVIWFQDWRICCYNLLDCPDPKPVCWHAKGKTPRSEMTVSTEVFSMQLYFYWPSTLCITVITVYFYGETGPLHYLSDSTLLQEVTLALCLLRTWTRKTPLTPVCSSKSKVRNLGFPQRTSSISSKTLEICN